MHAEFGHAERTKFGFVCRDANNVLQDAQPLEMLEQLPAQYVFLQVPNDVTTADDVILRVVQNGISGTTIAISLSQVGDIIQPMLTSTPDGDVLLDSLNDINTIKLTAGAHKLGPSRFARILILQLTGALHSGDQVC